jgi:hypothetical protein
MHTTHLAAGWQLLEDLGPMLDRLPMIMDKACEGDETRQLVLDLGVIPVVPPKRNRSDPMAVQPRAV